MFQPPRLTQPAAGEPDAVATITHIFLGKTVRIKVSDGRIFEGAFVCVDSDMNVILQGAHEMRQEIATEAAGSVSAALVEQKRWAGMVMLPGKHIMHAAVKATPQPVRPHYPTTFALPSPPPPAAGGRAMEKVRTDKISNAFPQDASLYG